MHDIWIIIIITMSCVRNTALPCRVHTHTRILNSRRSSCSSSSGAACCCCGVHAKEIRNDYPHPSAAAVLVRVDIYVDMVHHTQRSTDINRFCFYCKIPARNPTPRPSALLAFFAFFLLVFHAASFSLSGNTQQYTLCTTSLWCTTLRTQYPPHSPAAC